MANLAKAIRLAADVHVDQTDKAGRPYILHPLRMMMRMETENEKIVAVLHDVIEDTPVTLEDLQQDGYPEDIVEALRCLTRLDTETYDEFIERAGANPLARKIKIADLEDNMNLLRIEKPREKDYERVRKYHRAWLRLTGN